MGGTWVVLRPVVVVGVLGAAGVASAQGAWTATVLTPQNVFFEQRAYDTAGGVQAGVLNRTAAIWRGTAASVIDLGPANAVSEIYGTDGTQHVGYVQTSPGSSASVSRPVMWTGLSPSFVDLTPAGFDQGGAHDASGGEQVGTVVQNAAGFGVAALWRGSAQSFVNLSPSTSGIALAVHSGRQAGYIRPDINQGDRAVLWSGTAESRVDLHPSSFFASRALGIDATQQVGYTVRPGGLTVAALWSGSAESFVSLAGPGIDDSRALAVFNGYQVGHASTIGGPGGAAVWRGTAASMELLPLPTGNWGYSEATGVWADATTLYVTGWAIDRNFNSLSKAFLWTMPIPAPGSLAALALAGGLATRRRRA